MKHYSDKQITELHAELQSSLKDVRHERKFNVHQYIYDKAKKLNTYMNEFGLRACVVAVSGGIDSALVYALVNEARSYSGSPIEKVIPVSIPAYRSNGVTNQDKAYARAKGLIDKYGKDKLLEIDISDAYDVLKKTIDDKMEISGEAWANGQLVPYLRTPTYYYITSLLSQQGYKSIIVGTTNKDEGGYLGYFGKASDGMVDVQLISDIHKSEIYTVAKHLGVPKNIISAVPTGDMYDNRPDTEVFGSPYDFVEIYLHYLGLSRQEQKEFTGWYSDEAREQFDILKKNLDELHGYNKHKYIGASPAVHLDVRESRFTGGWDYNVY
jgi:NAD+ synthetase